MTPNILKVIPKEDYIVEIIYENGEQKLFDCKPYLNFGIFNELKDNSIFKTVRISFDTIEWSNGADICPEELYEMSTTSTDDTLTHSRKGAEK